MITQTQTRNNLIENLFFFLLPLQESQTEVTAQDLSFEIDESELAAELNAQSHVSDLCQDVPQLNPEDFESTYKWFIS